MRVVLSHPFSGALYAFFAAHNEFAPRPPTPKEPHSYYRTLYGDAFPRYQEMALTLALLFDEIIIAPADAYLPRPTRQFDDDYYNPDLGLRTEWDFEFRRQLDNVILEDLKDEEIRHILKRVPPHSREQILLDARHEVHLSQKYDCPIVSVGGRRRIIERILRTQSAPQQPYSSSALKMTEEYLRLVGPIFEPRDIHNLIDLRSDPDLRAYAASFVGAMERFRESTNVRADLLRALLEAMDSSRLARTLAGVFDGTATALNVVGLVPFLGTAASAAGLAAEGATKGLNKRVQSQSWYEFAGQVKRVASVKSLARRIESELSSEGQRST